MAMTLIPKLQRSTERLLVFGGGGVGKSKQFLDIARRVTDTRFYALDLDVSPTYDRLLETIYTDVDESGRFTVAEIDPNEWSPVIPQITQWTADAHEWIAANPGKNLPWLSVDPISPTWPAAAAWFSERVIGKDRGEWLLEMRQKYPDRKQMGKAIQDTMDYSVINSEYFPLYTALVNWPGHLYLTAEQDKIGEQDSKETQRDYGPYGVKPKGQKKLGHITSTVLWNTKVRGPLGDSMWCMTTVKDRGRQEIIEAPVGDFAMDYLVKVAGWKMARVDGVVAAE